MCVCGGGSSDSFHFPKFQGGPTYVIKGGGGGVKPFSKGAESIC